jgi:hypothetical protein
VLPDAFNPGDTEPVNALYLGQGAAISPHACPRCWIFSRSACASIDTHR